MQIRGRCHCGNIAFQLDWPSGTEQIPARACGCSFCRKHGGVWTSNPKAALEVTIADRSRVTQYAFGTRTAQFHVCSACGIVPVVTSRVDGHLYAVVSVNAFEGVDPNSLKVAAADFEGEDESTRLARRARNWIADVKFVGDRGPGLPA